MLFSLNQLIKDSGLINSSEEYIVFTRLSECNLNLSADKCFFFLQERVKLLGHLITKDGIEADPDKIEKIKKWP